MDGRVSGITKLKSYRPVLLAIEAIGWLHLTAKAKKEFLECHAGKEGINYDYRSYFEEKDSPSFSWDELLDWVVTKFPLGEISGDESSQSQKPWPESMTAFFTKHAERRDSGLLGLLQAGHAMASGIEKQSYPKNKIKYLRQSKANMWLSSAFGYPERNLLVDTPELLSEYGWKKLLGKIKTLLDDLKKLVLSMPSAEEEAEYCVKDLQQWRNSAVGPDGWLRRLFTGTLAETRIPINDVTLFDQSYVAAALFKSAVAGAILTDNFKWDDKDLKQKTRWRLLTVGIGTDHYEARSVKIGDLIGAQEAVEDFFDKVCRLVEVDLAIGSLLYADGEVRVFSFPGESLNSSDESTFIAEIGGYLAKEFLRYACEEEFETPPYCSISESSRSLARMTKEIEKAKNAMSVPLFRRWTIRNGKDSSGHVCPVCSVRLNGDYNSKQTPCKVCERRRTGRLDKWLCGKSGSDTIWIGELADSNDRLALITMNLEIEPWLKGSRLDSLRTQAISKWCKENSSIKNDKNPIDSEKPFVKLVEYIKIQLDKIGKKEFNQGDEVMKSLSEGYKHTGGWRKFYDLIVADRSDAPKWDDDNIDNSARARWITHQLFCKLASPGRVYRFQRQSEEFFNDLLAEFRKIVSSNTDIWRTRRLVIEPEENSFWNDKQIYNGLWGDVPIDMLYRKREGFLTLSNLSRLFNSSKGMDTIKEKELKLSSEMDTRVRKLGIRSVRDKAGELRSYCPVIPLEVSPVRFRVLLPLESVSDCVDLAVSKWREKFSRVWDRMPLRVGVVAFSRKTPFQTVIDASRSIEDSFIAESKNKKPWKINDCKTSNGIVYMQTGPDESNFLREMPACFPDGREDVYYPYLLVEDDDIRFSRDFQHPDGRIYRYVKDLKKGDRVHVSPSFVSTVFLDSATRRFEPFMIKQIDEWKNMRDLWSKIDKAVPSRTALRGAWAELVERRHDWQGPNGEWLENGRGAWLDLVRTVFQVRLRIRDSLLDILVEAAGNGVLEWSLEWHMGILKKGLSGFPEVIES